MLIPAIDLMGGKVVQLVQGKTKLLEYDDVDRWVEKFARFRLVHVVDLDAAFGAGDNRQLVSYLARRLPCQVGGGIRTLADVERVLAAGAQKVVIGSALIAKGSLNLPLARELALARGRAPLVFAVDSHRGKVVVEGWRENTHFSPVEMMRALASYCGAFLYTHVDSEGLMEGIPDEVIRSLRAATDNALCVAGGIASMEQVDHLDSLQVDAIVGMALYTGHINV